jgi:hypothetical protein
MQKLDIKTAIPKHRYQIGEFSAVLLSDIESTSATDYLFVFAVMREGEDKPGLYLTAEKNAQGTQGTHIMRLIMHDGETVLGASDRWENMDMFVSDAINTTVKLLGLTDEQAYQVS